MAARCQPAVQLPDKLLEVAPSTKFITRTFEIPLQHPFQSSTIEVHPKMPNELQDFLSLPNAELEELNLQAKAQRLARAPKHQIQEERLKYLTDEKRIKAVTVLFSDLEGRLHMLDYDKKFLIKSWDNMTFDGSSIRGFTAQKESDLRLGVDWSAFYWGPADVFGSGKVMVFGDVIDKQGGPYGADLRAVLKAYANEVYEKEGFTLNAANEIEGFLFKGTDAERHYHETGKFDYVSAGGYYHSLPGDTLRQFIDASAEFINPFGRSCLRFKFFNGTTGGFRGKSEDHNQTDQAYDRDERHRGADAERFDQHRKGRCPHHAAKQPAADPFAGRDADSPDRGRVLLRVPHLI